MNCILEEAKSVKISTWLGCFNLRLKVLSQIKNLVLGLTQENLIKFQVQSVFLIYTNKLACTRLYLTYSKGYVLFVRSTYIVYTI